MKGLLAAVPILAVALILSAPAGALATVHSVQIMDENDQPMVGLDVIIRVQTGLDPEDPNDWTEYPRVTDATGTAATPDVGQDPGAEFWEYEVLDVGPPDGYQGVDPVHEFPEYDKIAVLLDWYEGWR